MDEFTPGGQISAIGSPIAAVDAVQIISPEQTDQDRELRANLELAKAASDARFLMIVGKQVKWHQDRQQTPAVIETDSDYAQCTAIAKDMQSTLKSLEEIRLSYVAFPTKVIDMINGLFRQTKRGIEENQQFLKRLIAKFDTDKERERQAALEAAKKLNEEQSPTIVSPPVDGISKVGFAEVIPPPNSVNSAKGTIPAKKEADFDITVLNKVEFLRLLTSRATNQFWITEHAEELVSINFEKLKEILRNNPTKRKVAGMKITKV